MIQHIVVILFVAAAAVYIARNLRATLSLKRGNCGCGKGGCARISAMQSRIEKTHRR